MTTKGKLTSKSRGTFTPTAQLAVDGNRTPVDALRQRLSSPRLRSPGTIDSYLGTSNIFLRWLGPHIPPTPEAFRTYFTWRREKQVSERTLRKEFFHLKKLAEANGWEWPFDKEEAPMPDTDPSQPTFTIDEVGQMITNNAACSKEERFYMAVSTTWGSRCEELARMRKVDYDHQVVTLHIAKRHVNKKHLIPEVFLPVFDAYHPTTMTTQALNNVFHRMCEKTGVRHPKGYGWHSIRRMVLTGLEWELAAARLQPSWAADFLAWSKSGIGERFSGAAMAGYYNHSAEATSDPWYVEKQILHVHPFLKLWTPFTR